MTKSNLLCALLMMGLCIEAGAQTRLKLTSATCAYDGEETDPNHYQFDATDEATNIVRKILDAAGGVSYNAYIIKESDVNNAVATVVDDKRFILYSSEFLEKFKGDANTRWAAYSVMAHEIGHHFNNHILGETDPDRRKSMELEADKFSGGVLRTLGATLEEALAGIGTIKKTDETQTHPTVKARRTAITNGWMRQNELLKNANQQLEDSRENEPAKSTEPAKPVVDPNASKTAIVGPDACAKCNGTGTIVEKIKCKPCKGDGWVWVYEDCKRCQGTKRLIPPCSLCSGTGEMKIDNPCVQCKSTGKNLGGECKECRGSGYKNIARDPCTFCQGTGQALSGVCKTCSGKGNTPGKTTCTRCNGNKHEDCPDCLNGKVKAGKKDCEVCLATGRIDDRDRCKTCKGSGKKKS